MRKCNNNVNLLIDNLYLTINEFILIIKNQIINIGGKLCNIQQYNEAVTPSSR